MHITQHIMRNGVSLERANAIRNDLRRTMTSPARIIDSREAKIWSEPWISHGKGRKKTVTALRGK